MMNPTILISLVGQAWALKANGERRELHVGDRLQGDEMLILAPGAQVDLDFGDNRILTLLGEQSTALPQALAATQASAPSLPPLDEPQSSSADEEARSGRVLADDGPAPEGHNFVQLVRIAEIIEADGITPLTVARIRELLRPLGMSLPERAFEVDEWREHRGGEQRHEDGLPSRQPGLSVELRGAGPDGVYNQAEIGPDGTVTAIVRLDDRVREGDRLLVKDGKGNVLLDRPVTATDLRDGVAVNVPVAAGDREVRITATVTTPQGFSGTDSDDKPVDDQPPALVVAISDRTDEDSDSISLDVSSHFADAVSGKQLTYSATGLPAGLSIDPKTGLISGTIDRSASQRDSDGDGNADGQYQVSLTVTDEAGNSREVSFTWTIRNPGPQAEDDLQHITEDHLQVAGNVLTGVGSPDPAKAADSDPDGDALSVIGVAAGTPGSAPSGNLGIKLNGQYGTLVLNPDGSYVYFLDNDNPEVNALKDGDSLSDVFTYSISDGEGGQDTATLTIIIDGHTDGVPQVTVNDGNGTEVGHHSIAENATAPVTGEFSISSPDGLESVTVEGVTLALADLLALASTPRTIAGSEGTLTLTGYDPATGKVSYSYQQSGTSKDHSAGDNSVTDTFSIEVLDKGGATAAADLQILITDTAPQAKADAGEVSEDGAALEGNVLTGSSTNAQDVADILGGDATSVLGVAKGEVTSKLIGDIGADLAGDYGTLRLNADGSYTYTVDNGNPVVNALKDGETLEEIFSYTIQDDDGDWSTTTLTIIIHGRTDGQPSIVPVDGNGTSIDGHVTVKESGLPGGRTEGVGHVAGGQIALTAADGLKSINVGGQELTLAQLQALSASSPSDPISVAGGTLVLTGFTVTSNVGGVPTAATLSYTYTLGAVQPHDAVGADDLTLDIPLSITDVGNATASGTLTVQVIDDVPEAEDDTNTVSAGSLDPVTGNVITENDVVGADGARITRVQAGSNAPVDIPETGSHEVVGQYGTLTIHADGSYSYARHPGTPGGVQDVFTYTLTDGDKDIDTATLTISIDDATPSMSLPAAGSAATVVYESGLDAGGTEAITDKETTSGTIAFTAKDGLNASGPVKLNGVALGTDAANPTNVGEGLTAYYSYEPLTGAGTIYYSYTLPGKTSGDGASATFKVEVRDADGDLASSDLLISIVDDEPQPENDSNQVTEGALLSVDAAHGVLANDKAGADGWHADGAVVGVAKGATNTAEEAAGTVGTSIVGNYGTLTLYADGRYTYKADPNKINADVQDVFTYTVKDGDGDLKHATLTINVKDVTVEPLVTSDRVHEDGIDADAVSGQPAGTKAGTGSNVTSGHLDLQTGWNVKADSVGTQSSTIGSLTINADGTYSYTLNKATLDVDGADETDVFNYTVVDAYGNEQTNQVVITIVDDRPLITEDASKVGSLTVDESNFSGGFVSATDPDFAKGVFTPSYGADGPAGSGALTYALNVSVNGALSGLQTTSGQDVLLYKVGNDIVGRAGGADGDEVLRISIDADTGSVTLSQYEALKHPTGGDSHDESLTLASPDLITLTATATDGDGDSVPSDPVAIGDRFIFRDDGPVLEGTTNSQVEEKYLPTGSEPAASQPVKVEGNITVKYGQDGSTGGGLSFAAEQSALRSLLDSTGNANVQIDVAGNVLTATRNGSPVFRVTLDTDAGKYSFELLGALNHPSTSELKLSFDFIASDGDGDTARGSFTVDVVDDMPKSQIVITTDEDVTAVPFTTSADARMSNDPAVNNMTIHASEDGPALAGTYDGDTNTWSFDVAHGTLNVTADGVIRYTPNPDYSNHDGDANDSPDKFYVWVTDDNGNTFSTEVVVNVTPVADAPVLPHGSETADVDNARVGTLEDTPVALGLRLPQVKDAMDMSGAGTVGDDPERLGAITLKLSGEGKEKVTFKTGETTLTPAGDGTLTIVITETSGSDVPSDLHVRGDASLVPAKGTAGVYYLTKAEYEAIQVTPAENDHRNFNVEVCVTSYEVDGSGQRITGIAGATSTQKITVYVEAVTDDASLVFDTSKVVGDGVTYGGSGGNTEATVTIKEDATFNVRDILEASFQDLDGSEVRSITITNNSSEDILLNGSLLKAGESRDIPAKSGEEGQTGDIGSFPDIWVGGNADFSGTLNGIKITINAQDKDSDGYLKGDLTVAPNGSDGVAEADTSNNSVILNLRVTPVAGDVAVSDVATLEDTPVNFLSGLHVTDSDTGSEVITRVKFTLPEGWTLTGKPAPDAAVWNLDETDAGNGTYIISFTGGDQATREDLLDKFWIKPPAHSSKDADIDVQVTTSDTNSLGTDSKDVTLPVHVKVSPVAEIIGSDTDGNSQSDLTMNGNHAYQDHGREDEWFDLRTNGFDFKGPWSNEDGIGAGVGSLEETFARLTPYRVVDANPSEELEGSYFQYTDSTGVKTLPYNGTPVLIPIAYLDTVQFKGPLNFKGEVKIKVEALTIDHDEDDPSITDTKVSGEAWLQIQILDHVADHVTLKVNPRIISYEDAPSIPLSVYPTSDDPSETFNITIKGIPAGASITYDGQTYTVGSGLVDDGLGQGTYQLHIVNFDKTKQPTLTPPKDSNVTINLQVTAVSVDGPDTSAPHTLPITISLTGVPDEPVVTIDNDRTYTEESLDASGNQVEMRDLITELMSGETAAGDVSETVTLRISGLPEGFSVVGAGPVIGTATGTGRVWVVSPEQIADGSVKIQLPANYSGTVKFTAQPVVTENDNPSDTFFAPENVQFKVMPSPEAKLAIESTISEDSIGKLDLSALHQNGDTDELITAVRIKAVDGVTFYSDAAGTTPLLAVDGWYELDSVASVNSVYVKAGANYSGDIRLDLEYKVTDTAADGTTGPVTSEWTVGTHTLHVTPVTDPVELALNSINGQSGDSYTLTSAGSISVNLGVLKAPDPNAGNASDYDGSEHLTHILIQGVPESVEVQGAIFTGNGQWLLLASDSLTGVLTKDVVFRVSDRAGNLENVPIRITVVSQDGSTGAEAQDSITWYLTTDFDDGEGAWLPLVSLVEIDAPQTEDVPFTLDQVVSAEVDPSGSNQTDYAMTITLRTDPSDPTSYSGEGLVRTVVIENGQPVVLWTKTVTGVTNATAQEVVDAALKSISVLPPANANANEHNLNDALKLDVTVTFHNNGVHSEGHLEPTVELVPVTDEAAVTISATPVNEGQEITINLSVSNAADKDGDWVIVGGKLYLKLEGAEIPGVLKYGDDPLSLSDVSGVSGLPDGQYYVIEGLEPNGTLTLTYIPDDPYDSGSVVLKGWVQNQETGGDVVLSAGQQTLKVLPTNTAPAPDLTVFASGIEHDGENLSRAVLVIDGNLLPDADEQLVTAFIEGLPKDFTLYYGNQPDGTDAVLASNAGGTGGGNTWMIPVSGNTLPAYIAIQAPAHWSGTLDDLTLYLVSGEAGNEPTTWPPVKFGLTVEPKADAIQLSPTLSFGIAGDVIPLNLNAAMKDPVAVSASDGHHEVVTLQLSGFPDGGKVVFYVGNEEVASSYDEATGTHTISGLTQDELNQLGFLHLGTGGVKDIAVRAWTQEVDAAGNPQGAPGAEVTGTVQINIADKLSTTGNDQLLWTGDSIDGRAGDDTIQLRYGENLSGTDLADKLDNIEVLDLSLGGENKIELLTAEQVLDITDNRNLLSIKGTSEDSVSLSGAWSTTGATEVVDGTTYVVYTQGDATLHIQSGVSTSIVID